MRHQSELREAQDLMVEAQDGRQIGVTLRGPEYGVPIIALMGNPGSGQYTGVSYEILEDLGIREIGVDRAGMGNSDRNPNLSAVDTWHDLKTVATALGVPRYGIFARSGAVPGAVCSIDDNVSAAVFAAGLAPHDATFDWLDQMNPTNRAEQSAAVENPEEFERRIRDYATRLGQDPLSLLRTIHPNLQASGWAILWNPCWVMSQLVMGHAVGVGDGSGWIDHTNSLHKAWGRELSEIDGHFPDGREGRITFWHGLQDPFASPKHSRWLHAHIKGSHLIEQPNASHFISMHSAYKTIRDGHIGPRRTSFIELLNAQRLREAYGPGVDIDRPVTASEYAVALGVLANRACLKVDPLSPEERTAETVVARRILGDSWCYPAVAKEVMTSTDDELALQHPKLWHQALSVCLP